MSACDDFILTNSSHSIEWSFSAEYRHQTLRGTLEVRCPENDSYKSGELTIPVYTIFDA